MTRRSGVRRRATATRPSNQAVAVIFGLRENGDMARVTAYQLKDAVRLSGPNGSHVVHASNVKSIDGWRREAALVWNLTHVYDVMPGYENGEHERELYAELKAKSDERKRQRGGGS